MIEVTNLFLGEKMASALLLLGIKINNINYFHYTVIMFHKSTDMEKLIGMKGKEPVSNEF